MLPEQRRRKILEYMGAQGAADVPALAGEFSVSPATIRRDLQLLEERGHLERTHGGAVPVHVSTAFEPPHFEKAGERLAEKRAIGKFAARAVQNGEVVVLDSGSTTLALARELKAKRSLTVITTDLQIALELSDVSGFEVIIVGGTVRPGLYSVVGPSAESILNSLHANHAFIGADAIDLEAGVTNASLSEVSIKRLVIATAPHRVLVADHTKFNKVSLAKVASLSTFHQIVTDSRLDPSIQEQFETAGVQLARAEVEP